MTRPPAVGRLSVSTAHPATVVIAQLIIVKRLHANGVRGETRRLYKVLRTEIIAIMVGTVAYFAILWMMVGHDVLLIPRPSRIERN